MYWVRNFAPPKAWLRAGLLHRVSAARQRAGLSHLWSLGGRSGRRRGRAPEEAGPRTDRACHRDYRKSRPTETNGPLYRSPNNVQGWLWLGRNVWGLCSTFSRSRLHRRPCTHTHHRQLTRFGRHFGHHPTIFRALPRLPLGTSTDCSGAIPTKAPWL